MRGAVFGMILVSVHHSNVRGDRQELADLCRSPWAFEVPEYPEEGHSALESG
jgi:hypothetical protein